MLIENLLGRASSREQKKKKYILLLYNSAC